MVAGMVGSGKTVWVNPHTGLSLLQQAQEVIHLPPERIVWCYSQWQPGYMELLVTIRNRICQGYSIGPRTRHLFWHQQTQLNGDRPSEGKCGRAQENRQLVYRRFSSSQPQRFVYIVRNLVHQRKGSRSISPNSHFLVLLISKSAG